MWQQMDTLNKVFRLYGRLEENLKKGERYVFQIDNSKFGNERYKRNCARLGVFRDFNIPNTFTIESSCYAYEIKGTDEVE